MTTGIDMAIYASDSPDEIAAKLLENILIPILRSKSVNDGEDAAVQLYRNLVHGLCRGRVEMIGQEAVFELCGIANEVDMDYFGGAAAMQLQHMAEDITSALFGEADIDTSNFIESEGKPS